MSKSELKRLSATMSPMQIAEEWQKLETENAALRRICRDVYEVWAGSEGIPEPVTASEAYLLSLIEQMKDEAKRGLK